VRTTTDPAPGTGLAALRERYFHLQHTYDPYNATLLGLSEFDHLPGDPSRAASERAAAQLHEVAREAEAIDPAGLDRDDVVDRSVLIALARGAADDAAHSEWAANASAKGYVSRQGLVFQAVPAMTATEPQAAQRYLRRLAGLPDFFTALGERYAEEATAGRVPTRLGVQHAIEQLDGHLAVALDDDALLAPARGSGDPDTLRDATRLVGEGVRPALRALTARLRTELLPLGRTGSDIGIHAVPGGPQGYAAAIRRHTTTELTAPEIHRIGLDVLEEMRAEWAVVGGRALGETEFPRIAERLRSDPALRFETSAEIVAVARGALQRAEAVRDTWFPALAIPDCAIEEINPIDAAGSALGYYRPPALDGSRPGAYCVLAADAPSHFRYEYESLSFHEAVPGTTCSSRRRNCSTSPATGARSTSRPAASTRGGGSTPSSWPRRWGSTATTSPASACCRSGRCAPAGSSSTPASTTSAGPGNGRWSSCTTTPRRPGVTSRARSTATPPGRARRWST
jgi:uncharacterized protein (DUF885 family)